MDRNEKKKMKKAREKTLDKNVIKTIKENDGWAIKYWAGSAYTKSGIPDILSCINGHFVAIEDKAINGKPTLLQLKTLEKMRIAGGYGILLYPDQLTNFKKFVNDLNGAHSLSDESYCWYLENQALQLEWIAKLENE